MAEGITGGYWAHQPRGWLDVLRCMAGRHRPAMSGVAISSYVERCTCGAISLNEGPWMSPECRRRRVGRKESARLLDEDWQRERALRAAMLGSAPDST